MAAWAFVGMDMATPSLQTKLLRLQVATLLLFAVGAVIFCWRMIVLDQAIETHFDAGRQITALRVADDLIEAVAAGRVAEAETLRGRMRSVFGAVTEPNGRASAVVHAADKAVLLSHGGVEAVRAEAAEVTDLLQDELDAAEAAYRAQMVWAAFAWSVILALPLAVGFFPLRLSAGVIAGIRLLGRKVDLGRRQGDSRTVVITRQDEIGTLGRAIDETFDALRRQEAEAVLARQWRREQERLADMVSLTGGIAHEIANPLTVMLANLDLIEEGIPQVAGIREGLERIQTVLRDVTAFTSGDEHHDTIDVNAVVGTVYRVMRLDDRLRNVQFGAQLDHEVPAVTFPRAVLTLSLFSTLSQACSLVRETKGTMVVGTKRDGGNVQIFIRPHRGDGGNGSEWWNWAENNSSLNITRRVLTSAGGDLVVRAEDGIVAELSLRIPTVLPGAGER